MGTYGLHRVVVVGMWIAIQQTPKSLCLTPSIGKNALWKNANVQWMTKTCKTNKSDMRIIPTTNCVVVWCSGYKLTRHNNNANLWRTVSCAIKVTSLMQNINTLRPNESNYIINNDLVLDTFLLDPCTRLLVYAQNNNKMGHHFFSFSIIFHCWSNKTWYDLILLLAMYALQILSKNLFCHLNHFGMPKYDQIIGYRNACIQHGCASKC
jgi:hypothetical protein